MNWITKRYDQLFLVVSTVGLLVTAVVILLKAQNVGNHFSNVLMDVPSHRDGGIEVRNAEPDPVEAAVAKLQNPPIWTPTEPNPFVPSERGSLFVSRPVVVANGAIQRLDRAFYKDSLTGREIPNRWFYEHDLSLVDPAIALKDSDKDGFPNDDEWRGQTDPNNKESHPPYYTKLFLDQIERSQLRLVFNSYDGEPKKDPLNKFTFQVDTIELRQPSLFLKIGDVVPHTNLKLLDFQFKEVFAPNVDGGTDVSELTLLNTDTGEMHVLVYNRVYNAGEYYARFVYEWPQPGQMFKVKKGQEFVLRPETDEEHHYKLIKFEGETAQIRLPSGEMCMVRTDPRR